MAESSGLRFDTDAAQQIIARAADLQQLHRETISQEQLETLAEEVGLSPEFVRLALAERASPPVAALRRPTAQRTPMTRRDLAWTLLSALPVAILVPLLLPARSETSTPFVVGLIVALLAPLAIGFRRPLRRLGAIGGGVFGLVLYLTLVLKIAADRAPADGGGVLLGFLVFPLFGAALGVAGAGLRRLWNRLPADSARAIKE